MKNKFIRSLILVSFLGCLIGADASVSFNLQVDQVKNSDGTAASVDSLFFLVADTSQDGFDGVNSSIGFGEGNMLNGSERYYFDGSGGDDLILWRGTLNQMGLDGFIYTTISGLRLGEYDGNNWNTGAPLAVVWMPLLGMTDTATNEGDLFGLYSSQQNSGEGSLWFTPSDQSSGTRLFAFTDDSLMLPMGPGTGDLSSSSLLASSYIAASAVPEPSTYALVLGFLGMGVFFVRRRLR